MIPFSTPFDLESVDFLETLDCPIYKIASLETSDTTLIKKVAKTGKPIIISTGATYFEEIQDAVSACTSVGNTNITLLVCTSSYPAIPSDANLLRMNNLKKNVIQKNSHFNNKLSNKLNPNVMNNIIKNKL
jgi:sialic acid synthase SpsE